MTEFLVGVAVIFLGGVGACVSPEKGKGWVFSLFAASAQFLILPAVISTLLSGGLAQLPLSFGEPIGLAYLRLDPLAALFSLLISTGTIFASVYSIGYMKMYAGRASSLSSHYLFLGMMSAAMLLVVVVQNAILFLIVWEVMSVSSFLLVAFDNGDAEVRKAALYYFTAMQVGAAFLIAAFGWVSAASGSLDFNSFTSVLGRWDFVSILLFVLFFLGFGTKAGFVPLHTWLPRAHPAAPTGVSALMSGVMIKLGIYGILRILLLSGVPNSHVAYGVLVISVLTGIFGITNAIAQDDIKRLLAYSSIENVGIIGIGIGIGMLGLAYHSPLVAMLGFLGALLHTVNHFTFKSVLFHASGVIYSRTHTRDMNKLGGLGKYLPVTSAGFLIASLAAMGLPVFNGFISELALYLGLAKAFMISSVVTSVAALFSLSGLAFTGAMALLAFSKAYGITFLGLPRERFHANPAETEWTLIAPMVTLAVVIVAMGLLPWLAVILLRNVIIQFVPALSPDDFLFVTETLRTVSTVFTGLLVLTGVFLGLRSLLLKRRNVATFKTWDCGYQVGSARLQYTGSSFAQPFLHLVEELVPRRIRVNKEPFLFPKDASLESHTQDLSERFIYRPTIRAVDRFLGLFSWIQSGRMQQYIMYGLVFIVALLIWILGVK